MILDVTLCRLVNTHRRFEASCRLFHAEDDPSKRNYLPVDMAYTSTAPICLYGVDTENFILYPGVDTVFHTHTKIAETIVYEGHCKVAVNHSVAVIRGFVNAIPNRKHFLFLTKQEITTAFTEANYY